LSTSAKGRVISRKFSYGKLRSGEFPTEHALLGGMDGCEELSPDHRERVFCQGRGLRKKSVRGVALGFEREQRVGGKRQEICRSLLPLSGTPPPDSARFASGVFLQSHRLPMFCGIIEEGPKGKKPRRSRRLRPLKHQLPGASEKDELPAIVFARAAGAFRIRIFGLQMTGKFRLVAETGGTLLLYRRFFFKRVHVFSILPRFRNHFKIFWTPLRLILGVGFVKLERFSKNIPPRRDEVFRGSFPGLRFFWP
jgi:hypothetical protein